MARVTKVYKSDEAKRVRGNPIAPADLRGPVGEVLRKVIEESDGQDGYHSVDGHHYVWFTTETGDAAHPTGVN